MNAFKILFILRKKRLEKHKTQKYVAKISGISQSHISEIENGNESPTLRTVEQIATAIKVHPLELLEFVE
ncbi:helix-turn-helix domain-containing protein [Clostridium beijerinckii]|uniref:Helix-turn-helix transcriptional regulator n=1 Tax=Clostridium beijerinckii TaxID=1520 RepID=A0A7X9SQR5_CLOBE|nr:helix-turn-helix transcriptional regulator [Clostridium beijerinckii]